MKHLIIRSGATITPQIAVLSRQNVKFGRELALGISTLPSSYILAVPREQNVKFRREMNLVISRPLRKI